MEHFSKWAGSPQHRPVCCVDLYLPWVKHHGWLQMEAEHSRSLCSHAKQLTNISAPGLWLAAVVWANIWGKGKSACLGEIASHSSGKVCGDRDGGEGRQSRQDLPSGAASVCLLGGGVSGKTYSCFPYLHSKFIFVHYRRYSINSEWMEENLESGSLFLISSLPVHALQSCRCKNTSQGV